MFNGKHWGVVSEPCSRITKTHNNHNDNSINVFSVHWNADSNKHKNQWSRMLVMCFWALTYKYTFHTSSHCWLHLCTLLRRETLKSKWHRNQLKASIETKIGGLWRALELPLLFLSTTILLTCIHWHLLVYY